MKNNFSFKGKVNKFDMTGGWFFVMLPDELVISKDIQVKVQNRKDRFAKIEAEVIFEGIKVKWNSALLPHSKLIKIDPKTKKKMETSRLFIAIKKDVRKKIDVDIGDEVELNFSFV
jgi:hypothetical protein